MESHNTLIASISAAPAWLTGTFLLISQADIPMWLYLITAIALPLTIGFGGKILDILYAEYKERKRLKSKDDA